MEPEIPWGDPPLARVRFDVCVTCQRQLTGGMEASMVVDTSRIWEADYRVSCYSSS